MQICEIVKIYKCRRQLCTRYYNVIGYKLNHKVRQVDRYRRNTNLLQPGGVKNIE